jgi:hypothetical protein
MTGRYENVDGHRVFVPADAPASESSRERSPALISDSEAGSLPRFSVRADYFTESVAVLFAKDDIPRLCAHPLFAAEADQLHAAVVDIEQEIDQQIKTARERQITGGTR